MEYFTEQISESLAKEILCWKYEQPYDFYNNELSEDALKELLSCSYFIVKNNLIDVIGYFCIGESAQVPAGHKHNVYEADLIDMGLGMNPEYVGKGYGYEFCSFIIRSIETEYPNIPIRLTVACFNKRAIHLYQKLGFLYDRSFKNDVTDFITMIRN